MPGSPTGSTSLGRFSSTASAESLPTNELLTYRSKARELAQAMLSEIEDLLRGFDADLKAVQSKSCSVGKRSEGRSWSDVQIQFSDINASSSLGSCPLPSRSRLSWGRRDSHFLRSLSSAAHTLPEEGGGEGNALMTLIRNIYKMVSTDIAPKLHGVTQEVTQLRRNNELLTEKVEQQRIRNDKLLEEFEDLQNDLKAKDSQLREQRRVSKNLGVFQGENEMLKVELKSLRVRVEKMGGSSTLQTGVREGQEKIEVPCRRTSSNDWLRKENEELQREVARWRQEASEKDVLISDLKEAIKNLTAAETPRTPVQRKLSAARPEAMLGSGMGAGRAVADAASLDSQVATALTLETPRGRIRSSFMERLSPLAAVRRSPSATTLAQDLGTSNAAAADNSKDQAAAAAQKGRASRSRSGTTSAPPRAAAVAVDSADTAAGFGDLRAAPREEVSQWLEATSEAMERALFEVEDIRASRIKAAETWERRNGHLQQLLLQAEDKLRARVAEAQKLLSERNGALTEQRESLEKVEKIRKRLQESRREAAELQAALEKKEREMETAHKEAAARELRLMETVTAAEKQIAALQERIAFRDGLIMSIARNTNDWLLRQHLQASEALAKSNAQPVGATGAETPLRGPAKGSAANDTQEGAAGAQGCALECCGSSQTPQQTGGSRGQKVKVVFRAPFDTCCSTLNCLKLWGNGAAQLTQSPYTLEPPNGTEDGAWPFRKPSAAPKPSENTSR
ncbi:hypothetical protein, conserved [Eimeria brunetti]|uniref:Uncharacterized protein n=1 Tax=Eimeria brunetti TaxID=51314 RepID=U6LL38_9EIME|nr:hypothetical protein, conserved [Eimeria brunetti]